MTTQKHPKWNRDEFRCFLLLYAAMADSNISPKEKDLITSKIDNQSHQAVREEFDALNDFEKLNVIASYKETYYPTAEDKAELLVRIEELFEIDGEYTRTEHNLFMMLRKLL